MEIFLNNNKIEVKQGITLLDWMRSKELHEKSGVAVALNNRVVPKEMGADRSARKRYAPIDRRLLRRLIGFLPYRITAFSTVHSPFFPLRRNR